MKETENTKENRTFVEKIVLVSDRRSSVFFSGEAEKLTIATYPPNAEDADELVLTVDNPDVAIIQPDGKLIALSPGQCLVTAKTRFATGTFSVQVAYKIEKVQIVPENSVIMKNQTRTLELQIEPENAEIQKIEWKSENEMIATVEPSQDGKTCVVRPAQKIKYVTNTIIKCTVDGKTVEAVVQVKPINGGKEAGERKNALRKACMVFTGLTLLCALSLFIFTGFSLTYGIIFLPIAIVLSIVGEYKEWKNTHVYEICFAINLILLTGFLILVQHVR